MDWPALFVCALTPAGVTERCVGPDGRVRSESPPFAEAAWLSGATPDEPSLGARLRNWFTAGTVPALHPPFDSAGRDALKLLSADSSWRPDAETLQSWQGRVSAVAGEAPGPVVLDAWRAGRGGWRATRVSRFDLVTARGERVRVALQKAPLVIARPREVSVDELYRALPEALARALFMLLQQPSGATSVKVVTMSEGDEVEVLGLARPAVFEANQGARGGAFRASAGERIEIVSDEPDVRLVFRVRS